MSGRRVIDNTAHSCPRQSRAFTIRHREVARAVDNVDLRWRLDTIMALGDYIQKYASSFRKLLPSARETPVRRLDCLEAVHRVISRHPSAGSRCMRFSIWLVWGEDVPVSGATGADGYASSLSGD